MRRLTLREFFGVCVFFPIIFPFVGFIAGGNAWCVAGIFVQAAWGMAFLQFQGRIVEK